jgi:hypothetical protein
VDTDMSVHLKLSPYPGNARAARMDANRTMSCERCLVASATKAKLGASAGSRAIKVLGTSRVRH